MNPLAGPVLAAAALLVLAGAPKVARPHDTARALRSAGVPAPAWAVRLGGLLEAAIGIAGVVSGDRLVTALVAASYLGFTGFVVLALRTGGVLSSCGCLGRPDTPPTRLHALLTAGLAGMAVLAAAGGPIGLVHLAALPALHAAALVGFAGLLTGLCWLALAELPRLRTAPDLTR